MTLIRPPAPMPWTAREAISQPRVGGRPAQRRAGEEGAERAEEDGLGAEDVAQPAVEREHRGRPQRERGDQPRDLADAVAGIEVPDDRDGRRGHDLEVQDGQDDRHEAGEEAEFALSRGHGITMAGKHVLSQSFISG
ncbi:hypothetical protein ACGFYV_10920 [Streptomyces sp. NPDC048297]|uniref:hypothetical protein n=1 Tax=Streptomyces sp. NPDC048297 TaxID=3365531 RepID=UPI00371E29E7